MGIWLGVVGTAYIVYGRKQGAPVPLACGILMVVEPYLLRGTMVQLLAGLVLAAIPFVLR